MYKELFKKIINSNDYFSKEEQKIIDKLIKESILFKKDDKFEINSKFKIGKLSFEKNYALLEDISNEHKNIKLDFDYLNGAYDGDYVVAKRVFNPRSKIKAKVIEVFSSKAKELLVYVQNSKFLTVKENIELDFKVKQKYEDGQILLINSKSFELIKDIGNINNPKVDEFISLYLYKELIRLEKEIQIDAKMDDTNKRVDLTSLNFCTIDPASAKDHDDAIYYDEKNQILYVAIADVSYFVKENSALDKQAYLKSTSVYLPSKVLPMLPKKLSEDMCSLRQDEKRYAYVFEIHLDANNLEIKESKLYEAIIESKRKFSYGRIDRVLEGKLDKYTSLEKEIFDSLVKLYELTKSFRSKRLQKGYEFRSTELRLKLNHNSELESIEQEYSTASHQLVEECMLFANIEASKKVNSVGIYRIHEEPPFKAITKLVDDVNMLGVKVKLQSTVHETITHIQEKAKKTTLSKEIDELIIHSQTQAKYSSKNLGHFGLGFDSYSHFTSPIRRYSDLVLHRMLKTKNTPNNIDDICDYISIQERKVDQLVWDFEDRKYARFAKKHIGSEFKAYITDSERGLAKVYDKMAGMKVVLDNYKGQVIYSKLKVVIKSADLITKTIIASIKY
ncbi:ribonuclease R [Malaciobacter halophilus]|uniref:Ribonuclease R n=1 Tax=Malaciobacter halophilus TaxID=197482 RepID=A0A2N1J5A8_9BACT|nr:ribonuclease R family protein [Malaciobacter halophilus]AXH10718.1 ribonuclease R [Malaciobacter halophilus]PKI81741.1 ribonuclease R [Malaciobacter halophilus]